MSKNFAKRQALYFKKFVDFYRHWIILAYNIGDRHKAFIDLNHVDYYMMQIFGQISLFFRYFLESLFLGTDIFRAISIRDKAEKNRNNSSKNK